jgi:hypothetical protein
MVKSGCKNAKLFFAEPLVQHTQSVGLWVFLKKEASILDKTDFDLDDKFLSMG